MTTTTNKYDLGTRVQRVGDAPAGRNEVLVGICEIIIYAGYKSTQVSRVGVRWIPATKGCTWLEELPVSDVYPV
jgi:hypothetical protein